MCSLSLRLHPWRWPLVPLSFLGGAHLSTLYLSTLPYLSPWRVTPQGGACKDERTGRASEGSPAGERLRSRWSPFRGFGRPSAMAETRARAVACFHILRPLRGIAGIMESPDTAPLACGRAHVGGTAARMLAASPLRRHAGQLAFSLGAAPAVLALALRLAVLAACSSALFSGPVAPIYRCRS